MSSERSHTYAAVDLGSNSFHLLVARREHGELRVIDQIKEMIRLGGGLDEAGRQDPAVQESAFACLGVDRLLMSCLKLDRIDSVLTFAADRA